MGADVSSWWGIQPFSVLTKARFNSTESLGPEEYQTMPPGSLCEELYRDGDRGGPFYTVARLPDGKGVAEDVDRADETIGKVIEADQGMMSLLLLHMMIPYSTSWMPFPNMQEIQAKEVGGRRKMVVSEGFEEGVNH